MNRRRKALFLSLFLILVIDLLFFTILNMYPEVFPEPLIKYLGPDTLGPAIIGGFITAITTSTMLLVLSYTELRTIMGKPLRVKVVHPRVSARAKVVEKIKKILKRFRTRAPTAKSYS